jgi:hypothetical protein
MSAEKNSIDTRYIDYDGRVNTLTIWSDGTYKNLNWPQDCLPSLWKIGSDGIVYFSHVDPSFSSQGEWITIDPSRDHNCRSFIEGIRTLILEDELLTEEN